MTGHVLLIVLVSICSVESQLNFDSIEKVVNTILDVVQGASENHDCRFSCPHGYQIVRNVNHTPTSNGCGSLGVDVDLSHLPPLTTCCDIHDVCYDTCGSNRDECDDRFHRCLLLACDRASANRKRSDHAIITINACKLTAEMIYQGVTALGCKPYLDAQRSACTCVPSMNRSEL